MFDAIYKYIESGRLQDDFDTWVAALSNPEQFLGPAFQPTREQFATGFTFYLKVVAASLAIYFLVVLFSGKGSVGARFKMLASGLLGIFFLFVVAAAVHFPFSWLGGKASFLGTCMAYMLSGGPFAPITAIAQWIMVSAMPPRLRPYALSPTHAGQAAQVAMTDPETAKLPLWTGVLAAWALMIWTTIVTFRCLGFVHDLSGWAFWLAVVISFLISIPIGMIATRMGAMVHEPETA
jgi:hypothetical protein